MKYYYNGKKVRTSNNTYTHGIVSIDANGQVFLWACCGRYDLALKRYNSEINDAIKGKAMYEEYMEEINNGTYLTWGFDNNRNWRRCVKVSNEELAKAKEQIIKSLARCERIIKTLKIVELEARP